ncbi:MAG: hypothetical protein AAB922_07620, partial [Patescibacteria group bacterium]
AFFCWFIIFAREPYIPLALILYLLILIGKTDKKIRVVSLSIFIALSVLTVIKMPFADYFENIYTYNKVTIDNAFRKNDLSGFNILNIFLFPFKVFLEGKQNLFREILIILNFIFLSAGFIYSFVRRKKAFLLLFIILGVSNVRPVLPGLTFYEAFHMNVLYGILIFSSFFLLTELFRNKRARKYSYFLFCVFGLLTLHLVLYQTP